MHPFPLHHVYAINGLNIYNALKAECSKKYMFIKLLLPDRNDDKLSEVEILKHENMSALDIDLGAKKRIQKGHEQINKLNI